MKKSSAEIRKDLFVDEYFKAHMNATEAYRNSYGDIPRAKQCAHDLMNDPYVIEKIDKEMKTISHRNNVTKDELVNILYDIATGDGSDGGRIKSIEVLNKMLGFNEAEKRDINISEQPLFGKLDDEEDNE